MNFFSRVMVLWVIAAGTATTWGNDLTITSFAGFAGETNILLQATGDITFDGNLTLPELPPGATRGWLTVEAGDKIIIADSSFISAVQGWSLSFQAGNSVQIDGLFPPDLNETNGSGGTVTIVSGGQGGIIPGPVSSVQLIQVTRELNDSSVTAPAGTNVVFDFIPDQGTPLHCQWLKNGRVLPNETGEFLSLTNIRVTDTGNYTIVVRNAGGRPVTCTIHLHVQPQPPGVISPSRSATHHRPSSN